MTSSCAHPVGGKQWILHDYVLQQEADGLWTAVDLDDDRPPLAARTRQGLEWLVCSWHRTLQDARRRGRVEASGTQPRPARRKPRFAEATPVDLEPVEPVQLQEPELPPEPVVEQMAPELPLEQEPLEQEPQFTLEPWQEQGIQWVLARRGLVAAA